MAYVSPCWAVSGGPFTTVAGVAAENKKKGLLRPTTGHAVGLVGGEDAGCRRRRRWILLETLLPVTGVLGRLVKVKAKRTSAIRILFPADWSALCNGRPLTIILARSRGWVGGQGPARQSALPRHVCGSVMRLITVPSVSGWGTHHPVYLTPRFCYSQPNR